MSILSKERYLKRGEAFKVNIESGKILDTKLLSNLEAPRELGKFIQIIPGE